MIDDDAAARRQADRVRKCRLDLRFDLEPCEQRHRVVVQLQLLEIVRHRDRDVLGRILVRLLVIDQDFADLVGHVIAQRADDRVALAVDQERSGALEYDVENRRPHGQQVFEVVCEFLGVTVDARGAQDDAHAVRNLDRIERRAGRVAILARDAARNAAGARLVRLEDNEAAGEADEGRQCGALVASLFLVDLDDDALAFLEHVPDVRLATAGCAREILAGNFLEGQEAVPL